MAHQESILSRTKYLLSIYSLNLRRHKLLNIGSMSWKLTQSQCLSLLEYLIRHEKRKNLCHLKKKLVIFSTKRKTPGLKNSPKNSTKKISRGRLKKTGLKKSYYRRKKFSKPKIMFPLQNLNTYLHWRFMFSIKRKTPVLKKFPKNSTKKNLQKVSRISSSLR